MTSPDQATSSADSLGEEIGRLAMFLVHLDGYWQLAQQRGLSTQRRRLIEGSLLAAHRRIGELSAPLARPQQNGQR